MTNILITGGNGYLAKALYEALHINYSVTTVSRNDFDLSNTLQTNEWLSGKHFNVVIHTAIKGGHRLIKDGASVLDTNLKMYYNLLDNQQHYTKFINIGSGAEVYQTNSPYGLSKRVIRESVLDKNNLDKYFLAFKQDIIKNKDTCFDEIYLSPKEKLNLRFHQELITQKTSDLIEKQNRSFLWGCKCRSGKTYMFGGIIIKQFNIKKKLNVLIITPAPTETAPQFTDDLFNKFNDDDIENLY